MNTRQSKLLGAIIDEFITTALPVGSERLLEITNFPLSPATIRSEMVELTEGGFLEQPHVSAGRVPTALGYRLYVSEIMEPSEEEILVRRKFDSLRERYLKHKDQERVYDAVTMLSQMVPNICFATVPHRPQVFYMGFARALQQPELQQNPHLATGIAAVLEERFSDLLEQLPIDERVRYYIGEENFFPQISSFAIVITAFSFRKNKGAIGVLGPMRMDYALVTVTLDMVASLLREQ